jgi:hypothetical protein
MERSELAWDIEFPLTDFSKSNVDPLTIISGGPPKDGIPAIDKPLFVNIEDASMWLDDREPVMVLESEEKGRAYPLQILIYHEIVNDIFQGVPVTVTFCPLCNASIAFDRRINGKTLDFGTTGKLRNSDLIMYDRQTESWWQQFSGEAIVGSYTGKLLQQIPSRLVSYRDFKNAFPDGEVLSRDTGYWKPYGKNPYRGYDDISKSPFIFTGSTDPRLPAMERVVSVQHKKRHRIYPFSALKGNGIIEDQLGQLPLVIFFKSGLLSVLDKEQIKSSRSIPAATVYSRKLGSEILEFRQTNKHIVDIQTGSHWNMLGHAIAGPLKGKRLTPLESGTHFAFAWLAFNPDTEIFHRDASSADNVRNQQY